MLDAVFKPHSHPPPAPIWQTDDDAASVHCEDEGDLDLYEQLRLEAFHQTWSKIQSTINEVLKGINLKLFDQVLQWVKESFSLVQAIERPHHAEVC